MIACKIGIHPRERRFFDAPPAGKVASQRRPIPASHLSSPPPSSSSACFFIYKFRTKTLTPLSGFVHSCSALTRTDALIRPRPSVSSARAIAPPSELKDFAPLSSDPLKYVRIRPYRTRPHSVFVFHPLVRPRPSVSSARATAPPSEQKDSAPCSYLPDPLKIRPPFGRTSHISHSAFVLYPLVRPRPSVSSARATAPPSE